LLIRLGLLRGYRRELTRKYEIANRIAEGSVLDRDALTAGFTQLADALSNVVMFDRALSRESKEDFLRNLSNWPLILDDVANRQSKLQRGNGKQPRGDGSER
jgi:hypothetical protein